MTLDFPLLLVLLTLFTGIVWLLDIFLLAPRRLAALADMDAVSGGASEEMRTRATNEPWLVEMSRTFFPIILLVLVVRSFIVEPFRIPSGSMMPTLLVGDFILVNKFAYGLRLPVLNTRILDIGEPERGDVFVFRYPENPHIDYIKRVIGVPGDHIIYRNKKLTINGQPAPQSYLDTYVGMGSGASSTGARHLKEDLLGTKHDILLMPERNVFGGDFEYVVPQGQYFAMGDNRDNSRDSRAWGTVPEANLVGKAFMIWMNWDWEAKNFVDWKRLGNSIN
jgi:signal peptidase I